MSRPQQRFVTTGNVSIHLHSKGNFGGMPEGEVIVNILAAIRERGA